MKVSSFILGTANGMAAAMWFSNVVTMDVAFSLAILAGLIMMLEDYTFESVSA